MELMNLNIEEIAVNPYLMISGYFIAIVSLILAIAFYLKGKREKKPTFQVFSRTLIDGINSELNDLNVIYKNIPQKRVTLTTIAFWNAGRETIKREDIANSDNLRIVVPGGICVLDVKILKQNVLSNEFELLQVEHSKSLEENTNIPLSFEYIDYQNTVVIQIVHTGDSMAKVRIIGKIKGAENIEQIRFNIAIKDKTDLWFNKFILLLLSPKGYWKVGGIAYFVIGMVGMTMLLMGNTKWYAWILFGAGFTIAFFIRYLLKPKSPIDIF